MIRKLFSLAALTFLLASCTNAIDNVDNLQLRGGADSKLPVFYATIEGSGDAATKVYADDQLRVLWNADDRITVFNKYSYGYEYSFTGQDGDNAGEFTAVPNNSVVTGNALDHVYALYPHNPATKISNDGVITATLPANQTYKPNSFGIGANTMLSVTDDTQLRFKNVGGYLSFKFYGDNVSVKSITLKGNNGEKLAGKASITMTVGGTPTVEMQQDATESITLTCETPVIVGATAQNPTEFWFVVPPTTFSKGFTVTVTDSQGGIFEKSTTGSVTISRNNLSHMAAMELVPVMSDNIFIPDNSFKAYLVDKFDTNKDGEISKSEALIIERIEVETDNICTFAGIEHFPNLRELIAEPRHTGEYGVGIGEDWRNSGYTFDDYNGYNTVTIVHGKLNVLDLSGNPLLETLNCSGNALTSVDLTANPNLKEINLKYNPDLSELKLGNNEKVHTLGLSCTSLTSIDVSGMPELRYLSIDRGESMSSGTVDVSHNPKLENLGIDRRGITHLDVSHNPQLMELSCSVNSISTIDLSNNENLRGLYLSFNQIQSLSVSKNCKLTSLMLQNNKLSSLDITMLPDLQFVHIGNYVKDETTPVNTISEIDLSANIRLERFFSSILDINKIDLSRKEYLVFADCCYNNLVQELDVSDSPLLETLWCYGDPALTTIYVASGQSFDCAKDANAHYAYKGEGAPYTSTDFSQDGVVTQLQAATAGNGINIVLMGDAFSDRLIADGTYDRVMNETMEAFFGIEPYHSFRDHFNVYSVKVVSLNETYDGLHETALNTQFGGGTYVSGNDGTVFDYAREVPSFNADYDVVCVVMNKEAYAGTCFMYYTMSYDPDKGMYMTMSDGSGAAIAYFPLGTDADVFKRLVQHEAGGHGFAKLADEYFYSGGGAISEEDAANLSAFHETGWYTNVDTKASVADVLWTGFLQDERYTAEGLGVYEGAFLYEQGVYRPSLDGLMNSGIGVFNAPSRKAIYNCIGRRAYGDAWQFDYESFVTYDAINRNAPVNSVSRTNDYASSFFPPLHSPVVKNQSWKDALSQSKRKIRRSQVFAAPQPKLNMEISDNAGTQKSFANGGYWSATDRDNR